MRRLGIAVAILLLLLAVADRVGARVAAGRIAGQIRPELNLSENPHVAIHGIPFLTQALRGRYGDIQVAIPSVTSGALQNVAVDAHLRDLRAPLSDVLNGRLSSFPVRQVDGLVSVRYVDLARASKIPGLRIEPAAGQTLRLTGSVTALGQQVAASGLADLSVRDNLLEITVTEAEVNGVPLSPQARREAGRLLSFQVSAAGLPLALRITSVRAGADALSISAVARDVTLSRNGIAAPQLVGVR